MARTHPQHPRPPHTHHPLGPCLVVAAGALIAAVSGCSSSSNTPAPAPASSSLAPAAPAHVQPSPAQYLIGQITAENGANWTIKTHDGQTHTATINDATRFGTSKHPATKDQFKVGDPVRVTATISGPSITATQIRTPADHQPHSAP